MRLSSQSPSLCHSPGPSLRGQLRQAKVSRRHNLLSLSTSAILGLRDDLSCSSLTASSVVKATHLLTSSVRFFANRWIVPFDKYATLDFTSLGNKELRSVQWGHKGERRTASVRKSSGEKCTPTVAFATYPLLGVLSKRAWSGKAVCLSSCRTCLNSGTKGGKFLRG